MAKRTNTERLVAIGGFDADWGHPAYYPPERYFYKRTGSMRSKLHLTASEPWATAALCGVGVWNEGTGAVSASLIDSDLCGKCLRVAEAEFAGEEHDDDTPTAS